MLLDVIVTHDKPRAAVGDARTSHTAPATGTQSEWGSWGGGGLRHT